MTKKHFEIFKVLGSFDNRDNIHFFTNGKWSNHELVSYILFITGKANVLISSFSISDVFIRSLHSGYENGYIERVELIMNKAIKKTKLDLLFFASNVVDKIALSNNHTKITLIENENWNIVINQSANATINHAEECGIICFDKNTFDFYKRNLNRIIDNSLLITKHEYIQK